MNFFKYSILFVFLFSLSISNINGDISGLFKTANNLITKNKGISLAIGAGILGATYWGYKKRPVVKSAWQKIKGNVNDFCDNYDVPVSVGLLAKLGIVGIAGLCFKQYVTDKIDFSSYIKKLTNPINLSTLKSQYQKMSMREKIVYGTAGLTAITATGWLTSKIYRSVFATQVNTCQEPFIKFKNSLNEDQQHKYKELIKKIENDKSVLTSNQAVGLISSLSASQHILAERIVYS